MASIHTPSPGHGEMSTGVGCERTRSDIPDERRGWPETDVRTTSVGLPLMISQRAGLLLSTSPVSFTVVVRDSMAVGQLAETTSGSLETARRTGPSGPLSVTATAQKKAPRVRGRCARVVEAMVRLRDTALPRFCNPSATIARQTSV